VGIIQRRESLRFSGKGGEKKFLPEPLLLDLEWVLSGKRVPQKGGKIRKISQKKRLHPCSPHFGSRRREKAQVNGEGLGGGR